MNQIVHIFKKDLRRFSWEIALSLALLALYAWCQPVTWRPIGMFSATGGPLAGLRFIGATLGGVILVLAWMIILVRVVFEESPAGDKQFWVTRPYRWPSLLGAKILFLVTVIHAPLMIVQLGLLRAAGFAPLHDLPRLIYINLLLAALLLPFAALAVVTGGRTQLSRAGIVVLIFLVGWLALGSRDTVIYSNASFPGSLWDWLGFALLAGFSLVVIVRQYALRRTVQSRWILVGGAVAITLLSAFHPENTLDAARYPLLPAGPETYFQMNMAPPDSQKDKAVALNALASKNGFVLVNFNLYGSEVAEGQVVQANAAQVTLQAPDGTHWNSGWQWLYTILDHEETGSALSDRRWHALNNLFQVDRNFFDRFKDVPISVHVDAAATLYRETQPVILTLRDGELIIPGIGYCVEQQDPYPAFQCRSDLTSPPMLGITARLFKNCPPDKDDLAGKPVRRTAWVPDAQGGGDFGLSPVHGFVPYLNRDLRQAQPFTLCSDAPFILQLPEKVRQFRVGKDFQDVKLADFVYQR